MNPLNLTGNATFGFGTGGRAKAPSTGSTGFSFGSTTTPAATTTATTTSTGFGGLSTPTKPFSLSGTPATTLATTTATPATTISNTATTTPATSTTTNSTSNPGTQTTVTFKILEDYINKWMSDLDSQEKDFLNQATQLNALDKLMIENGDKIVDLNNEVDRLNSEQEQLDHDLDFIFSQQNDLEESIKKLEVGIEQMPIIPQQHSDTSRIEMYKLLIEVDNQLKSKSGDLKELIQRLNETNVNLNDPIFQISKILNAHMDSLNWIEENTGNF